MLSNVQIVLLSVKEKHGSLHCHAVVATSSMAFCSVLTGTGSGVALRLAVGRHNRVHADTSGCAQGRPGQPPCRWTAQRGCRLPVGACPGTVGHPGAGQGPALCPRSPGCLAAVSHGLEDAVQVKQAQPLHLPATACHCLPLPATACRCLPLPATACHCLPLPATACHCLPLPATACHCLPLPATACHCLPLPATACHFQRVENCCCRGMWSRTHGAFGSDALLGCPSAG